MGPGPTALALFDSSSHAKTLARRYWGALLRMLDGFLATPGHQHGPGLTQTQLTEVTGTSQHVVSTLETVAEYPTVPVLLEFCRALKVEKRLSRNLRVVAQFPERDQRAARRLIDSAAKASKAG